jgi:hypothetical protein
MKILSFFTFFYQQNATYKEAHLGKQPDIIFHLLGYLTAEERSALSNANKKIHEIVIAFLFLKNSARKSKLGPTNPEDCFSIKTLQETLLLPCPFFAKKRIWQTHRLIYIPRELYGEAEATKAITFHNVQALYHKIIGKSEGGIPIEEDFAIQGGYYALITKGVIPQSVHLPKEWTIRQLRESHPNYEMAKAVEIFASFLTDFAPIFRDLEELRKEYRGALWSHTELQSALSPVIVAITQNKSRKDFPFAIETSRESNFFVDEEYGSIHIGMHAIRKISTKK